MLWIRRCLAVGHFVLGSALLLGVVSYSVTVARGIPQLLRDAPRTNVLGSILSVAIAALLPQSALGAWMLILARWLWSGHRWLRQSLLATHGILLFLGGLAIKWGFDAMEAADRSTARGGGLLSPVAVFPFFIGVPLVAFALFSLAVALWAVPREPPVSPPVVTR